MAKDRDNTGGPSQKPKDTPTDDRDNRDFQAESNAQSGSKPIADEERDNREGEGESRRTGSESNANNKRSSSTSRS